MDINELENFRIQELNRIEKLKFKALLYALSVPVIIFITYHFFGAIEAMGITIIFIFYPLMIFSSDIFDFDLPFGLVAFIAIFLLFSLFSTGVSVLKSPSFKGIITIIIFLFISMFGVYASVFKSLKNKAKEKYVEIVKTQYLENYFFKFGFTYKAKGEIMPMYIRNSKIFKLKNTSITQSDKVSGKIDGVFFEFSDMLIWQEKKDIICGVFFHATFNKKSNFQIFIASKNAEVLNNKNLKQITMDDTKFNATFSVYCDDMQNAMYILSPAFMKRLLDLKRRLNFPISVSFVGDKIYIFLDTGKDNFEPDIDKSVLHANPAFTIKRELSHFLSIVKTLNLNTKIWKI